MDRGISSGRPQADSVPADRAAFPENLRGDCKACNEGGSLRLDGESHKLARPLFVASWPLERHPVLRMVGGIDPISSDALPAALTRLLDARDPGGEDVAWREFVGTYSTLLLQVARSTASA